MLVKYLDDLGYLSADVTHPISNYLIVTRPGVEPTTF